MNGTPSGNGTPRGHGPDTFSAQTSSRRAILDRIRTRIVRPPDRGRVDEGRREFVRYADPLAQFLMSLEKVGGQGHVVGTASEVEGVLRELAAFREADRVASVSPEAVTGNVDLRAIGDPHDLATLDWMIARGEFMVAENGAIWIDGQSLAHRVAIFIAQYLAIVVPRRAIVNNMHEAYARIGPPRPGFGIFVSGPSKTADIEQSLVLGAHGCRALQVVIVGAEA